MENSVAIDLVRSVSGLRGIVGRGLTDDVARAHAAAFAAEVGGGAIAVGRDSRPSGPRLGEAVAEGLAASGAGVTDLGLCATPAVQVAVEELGAAGGIILTASHNPAPWNGLKFVGPDGTFLGPARIGRLFAAADAALLEDLSVGREAMRVAREDRAVAWHVARAFAVPEVSRERIAAAGLRVVVDGCRSVGGLSTPRALREAGCEVVELDCVPDGQFTRGLEPLAENLAALGRRVVETGAHFGVAHDPDGDRAALVDERGEPLGEELTLAIAVAVVLAARPGPVVVNLSTSRASEDLAARHGVPFTRAPVGESNVVEAMRAAGAVVGGEGNGGVIVPAAHLGRDGTVAALLAAQYLAGGAGPMSRARAAFGGYAMRKEKVEGVAWAEARARVARRFADARLDTADGLRFAWAGEWLHVRPSGTEPMVRVIAEAADEARARELCAQAREALTGSGGIS
jgi:phosphomannomutase